MEQKTKKYDWINKQNNKKKEGIKVDEIKIGK